MDLSLSRGDLTLPGLQHLAHHDVLHVAGRHLGALERGLDRRAAEFRGVEARQATPELADRCAGG